MPMTQADIRSHYEQEWAAKSEAATDTTSLGYSNPVEDAVVFPMYEQLVSDLGLKIDGGRVLDVGSGSGRWIRFLLERFRPGSIMGIDFSRSSIELLETWHGSEATPLEFRVADISGPDLDLGGPFDLINVANVLFHIPEPELFARALANLARHVAPNGAIVTTEFLPRCTMRTEWMMVRSRYEFEAAARAAGLRISTIRGFSFFSNDPLGLDGPDQAVRRRFHEVRRSVQGLFGSGLDEPARAFFVGLFAEIERAILDFARERVADIDLPSQKLVVLRPEASGGASA